MRGTSFIIIFGLSPDSGMGFKEFQPGKVGEFTFRKSDVTPHSRELLCLETFQTCPVYLPSYVGAAGGGAFLLLSKYGSLSLLAEPIRGSQVLLCLETDGPFHYSLLIDTNKHHVKNLVKSRKT